MLVELGLVEQRHKAVLEVLDGAPLGEVALRNGVTRQTVHRWLRRYASIGLAGLADHSCRPARCPHQMSAEVEVRILELREEHPGWGPRTLRHHLGREGVLPLPGRSSIYRWASGHFAGSVTLLVVWVGISALLRGITEIMTAFGLRKLRSSSDGGDAA